MVKILSRDAINRMVGRKSSVAGVGGGGGDVDLSGYATKIWTQETFVSIDFFRSLFRAYDSQNHEILPNDTTSTIDNIKAMFGFWTDFYVSALGTGGQSSLGIRLAQLADVNVAGVTNGQVLTYDTTSGKWIASTPQSGTDMATVWSNLAASSNEQINYTHISNAVKIASGTITIGSSTITPITQSIGDNRYLKLSGGEMTGAITMKANQYTGNYAIDMNNSDIVNANSIYTKDLSDSWDEGIEFKRTNGYYDSFRAADGTFYFGANNGTEKDAANIGSASANLSYLYANSIHPGNNNNLWLYANNNTHIIANGPLIIPISNDVALSSYGRYALAIGGDPRNNEAHIGIDNNEIMAKGSASTTAILYLNAEGGTVCINETAGNCGIGTSSPSHKLHVSGGIYASSYVSCLSDERQKDIVGEVELTVEQIATARTVLFTWKDKHDNDLHMGCIAQDWQVLTPQLVHDRNDELSMEYSVIAAVGTVKNSQRLVNHETRLRRLEKMFALNENDIED